MMTNDKVAVDESERLREHEAIKGEVRAGIHSEITRTAEVTPADQVQADTVARQLRSTAFREIASTEGEVARARMLSRVSEYVDYGFYMLYGIVGLATFMALVGARRSSGITQFVETISGPFLAPFSGVLPNPGAGGMRLMLSYFMALVIYMLIHAAVNGLIKLVAHNRTQGI